MIRIASLLRRASFPGLEAVRGPKKKKGQAQAKVESNDIVNIFKDRTDPEIRDIRDYPIYVQQLSRGAFSVHQFYRGIQHNNPLMMPGRANLKGYLKAWKRQRTKLMGQYWHMDRRPDIMSENDINHRRTVYNVARLGEEEEEAKRKKEEEEELAAMEDDEEQ